MWSHGLKKALILFGIILGVELYAADQEMARGLCDCEQDAVAAVLSKLVSSKVYPNFLPKSFFLEGEDGTSDAFQFAVRFNQVESGRSSASTLIGRFLVRRSTCEVLYHDVAPPFLQKNMLPNIRLQPTAAGAILSRRG